MGTQATGALAQIIIDEETAYGADPNPVVALACPFVSENLQLVQNFIQRNTITSARNQNAPRLGKKDVAGGITVELNNHHHAYLIKHLLGSVDTTGTYDHEMKVGTLPVGLVIEKGFMDLDTPEYFKYNGCRINRGVFTFPNEGVITARFDIIGAKETIDTSSIDDTPTADTDEIFDAFDGVILEGGGAIATVTEAVIEISNDLDPNSYCYGGAGVRSQLPAGQAIVSGSITTVFDSIAHYTKAVNSTETSLTITLTRDASNTVIFEIHEMIYEPHAPVVDGPRGIMVTLPFRGYYGDHAAASALEITIKNDIATI